ncbi:unnamed protein product [Rangifer tarandus platyrhynchus]|uniref:Uncharacterized protein n=2 Tax=Rangifer tarandus platyrhynchus TaxID=3082113 RepID=A0ACB0FBF1_RANTA|nr:unnamed protein product [Rangifer tarandus platyrhynchus]CAI9709356.1 unnamed protein product [Rangifer tarandus platyrhynchus]
MSAGQFPMLRAQLPASGLMEEGQSRSQLCHMQAKLSSAWAPAFQPLAQPEARLHGGKYSLLLQDADVVLEQTLTCYLGHVPSPTSTFSDLNLAGAAAEHQGHTAAHPSQPPLQE